ncbi:MAG: ABC transporter substrate-binding protein [Gemmatimonadetes bacterium]|nr:ABC transporter substrate-binding protein [Gemmatimonadota bacterium]MCY3944147.1 ABC transporter substrate-binding protein [Gemmatimonadota bacterium]
MIRSTLFVSVAAAAVAGIATPRQLEAQSVTAVSWGGSYGRAVHMGVNLPFTQETDVRVIVEDYNGGLAQIRAQVEAGNIQWDVVDLEIADMARGCDEGLLEPVDISKLPPGPDGVPAVDDFVADAHAECGVGQLFWSTVYAYNTQTLESDEQPATMADFFDLERFPGRRGMRRVPQVNLEFALIADGVPTDEVYATLGTPEGLDRAFAKLSSIKDQVVWWEAGAQPPQMLADGEVVMSTAYNGRIFNAQVLEGQPFKIVWDGQMLDIGVLGIVAGTPRLDEALRYLAFATTAESQARIGNRISYSPARRSGTAMIGRHVLTGLEMAPHMPATPENTKNSLRFDWRWWADHQDELNERFSAWLAR